MLVFLAYSGLLTAIAAIIFGLFVYLKNRQSEINKSYAFLSLSIALWGLAYYFWPLADNKQQALISFQILHMGAILIAPSFLWFILSLLDLQRRFRKIIIGSYLISIFLLLTVPTPLFIKDMVPLYIFHYWAIPGFIYHFYLLFWFSCIFFAWFYLIKGYRGSAGTKRNQLKYVLIASLLGFLGGATNYLPWYKIYIPPVLNFLVGVHIIILAYAIVRHQLMDIEVLIKKSLVFTGMFASVLGIFVAITLLVSQFIAGSKFISLAVSALIITLLLRPIENWLVNTTDKFLFQKKHEYKEILKAFIDEVVTVLNLDQIILSTLDLLDEAIHPYTSGIFILNRAEDKYQLYNSRGLGNKEVVFSPDSKLITFLKKSRQPAVSVPINGVSPAGFAVGQEMSGLEALICLPLLLHEDLIGFISLGRKKSDLEYTKDDLDILLDLARTESIAVGNAQLLQEAAQSERRAAIGTMAAGIYHEIGNPLNIINTKIQVFLAAVERGLYRNKSKEEIILECKAILNNTLVQTNRIADITRRLSNFAKPSKEFKPQLIDISEEIGEALAVVGHDLELGRITIDKEIFPEMPKILADKRAMQQVFFNLIRNAAQAIEETGSITIRGILTGEGKARIEIEDTGKGIPDDKKHRVFEPFFTTKGPKGGTGLGLSIVRQLVWQNRGEISFRSRAGEGTTFILEFPRGAER